MVDAEYGWAKTMRSFFSVLALGILLAGCASTDSGRRYPGGTLERSGLPAAPVILPHDVTFKAKPNWGRARTYVLPAGEYRYHGRDEMGYFVKHTGKGFRYDSMGSMPGGFFIPFGKLEPWGLWTTGASASQAMALLGPAGAGVGSSDPDAQAIYIVDLPEEAKLQLEVHVSASK